MTIADQTFNRCAVLNQIDLEIERLSVNEELKSEDEQEYLKVQRTRRLRLCDEIKALQHCHQLQSAQFYK